MAETTQDIVLRVVRDAGQDSAIGAETQLDLDSIQALRVLIELERHFDVEIDEDEIFDGWFNTPELICQYVERLAAARVVAAK